jgi:tripartite-type tricarboxylate transporter receptor subunit TctC
MAALALAGLGGLPLGGLPAAAQDYPTHPVRVIVPFPPGGSTDVTGRLAAEYLSQHLGQTFVVENKPGAGTSIGLDYVAKAKPDGYTLVWGTSDGLSILPAVRKKLPYKVPDDFTFIGTSSKSAGILVAVSTKLPFKTMGDLIAYAKANPGKLRYSTSGTGGGGHLATELISRKAGIKMTHIAFSGMAPAMTAVMGGHVDVIITGASLVKPNTDSGVLRPLAVADAKRHPQFPDVPTLDELGIKDVHVGAYVGLLGPAGLPDDVVKRLQRAMGEMSKDKSNDEKLRNIGFDPSTLIGDAYKDYTVKDLARWTEVAKIANISLD